jgi:hypothetical protein
LVGVDGRSTRLRGSPARCKGLSRNVSKRHRAIVRYRVHHPLRMEARGLEMRNQWLALRAGLIDIVATQRSRVEGQAVWAGRSPIRKVKSETGASCWTGLDRPRRAYGSSSARLGCTASPPPGPGLGFDTFGKSPLLPMTRDVKPRQRKYLNLVAGRVDLDPAAHVAERHRPDRMGGSDLVPWRPQWTCFPGLSRQFFFNLLSQTISPTFWEKHGPDNKGGKGDYQ